MSVVAMHGDDAHRRREPRRSNAATALPGGSQAARDSLTGSEGATVSTALLEQERGSSRKMEEHSVDASVIVGLVNGGEMIDHLLKALARQTGEIAFEVIIASRCQDGTAQRIAEEYPEVKLITAARDATLPELRTLAFERARGRFIFVTEDHTVPPPNWIERFVHALKAAPQNVVAVGGPVENGMCESATDRAAFLCEYSGYLPPLEAGETDDIPGMNIAYRREVLDGTDRELLERGFWESTVHPTVLEAGKRFLRLPDVVIEHRKSFGFSYFVSQRFHYSRYFAGTRFRPDERASRMRYCALSLALPALVLWRISTHVLRRPSHRSALFGCVPALICFAIAWGIGEVVGYAFGPGKSLVHIE